MSQDVEPGGHRWTGPLLAAAAAFAFSLSVPVGKLLLEQSSALPLAGLLYLGAGLALTVYRLVLRAGAGAEPQDQQASVQRVEWASLGGAILAGGVAAPVFLLLGLQGTPASTTALLLSLEVVLTALVAGLVFREHIGPQVWWAVLAVAAGIAALSVEFNGSWGLSWAALGVIGACAFWAVDNNLTQRVANLSPPVIAQLKGVVAGGVNLGLALVTGAVFPPLGTALLGLALGSVSYGLSLVLFIHALRRLGTSRTVAWFGAAPFFGAGLGLAVDGRLPDGTMLLAGVFMLLATGLMVSEQHVHEHRHGEVIHVHWHAPDLEHRHDH